MRLFLGTTKNQTRLKTNFTYRILRVLATALVLVVSATASLSAEDITSQTTENPHFFYTRERTTAFEVQDDSTDFEQTKNLAFTVKTNLLYDLATAFNIEVEVPIATRFSILVDHVYPWWETHNKFCLQVLEFGPEFRFWFTKWDKQSEDKLKGWFAGVYGMTAKYDFQFDTDLDYQGEFFSAGISGGYVYQPKRFFGKEMHTRLEFSIAAGYLVTDFRHYLPTDDYSLLIRDKYNVGRVSYFGPTKAKISLIVPIMVKNDKR